jgi:hypothetical protein
VTQEAPASCKLTRGHVGKLVTVMIYVLKKIPEELRRLAVVGVVAGIITTAGGKAVQTTGTGSVSVLLAQPSVAPPPSRSSTEARRDGDAWYESQPVAIGDSGQGQKR